MIFLDILTDDSPTKHHSVDQRTRSPNSSKDSGISDSTKTDKDQMKGVYSNDEDAEFLKIANYKVKAVGSPPTRRKAIVRTINNDAKVRNFF